MGAPASGMQAAEQPAEALLTALKTIDPAERQKHQAVLDYWLSIRANRELPPLRDLDPLEISDAAPSSVLLELVGGGEDAEIRHLGERLRTNADVERVGEAPRPSVLASIARKLSIVAVSRNFLAFEDEFTVDGEKTRCWVTMLPLSSAGAWVDYVYAFVSVGPALDVAPVDATESEPEADEAVEAVQEEAPAPEAVEAAEEEPVAVEAAVEDIVEEDPAEEVLELDRPVEEPLELQAEAEEGPAAEAQPTPTAKQDVGFSFDSSVGGFYAKAVKVKPTLPEAAPAKSDPKEAAAPKIEEETPLEAALPTEAVAEEQVEPAAVEPARKPISATEGSLQSKLTQVRAKADEARMAKLRANAALYEGLSAAYDFALDAEDSPEEYLKIVEAQGLKIQLRSPMRPVVKLAFDGMCDDATIAHLEAVLAWAIEQELPRGSLAKHIEEAGGIGPILSGLAKAA